MCKDDQEAILHYSSCSFYFCQLSGQEFDDEIASIDSQTMMDHNASNDIIDGQLNSKDNDDNDDDDDDN